MAPGWLEFGDKIASMVGALCGLLALVVAVRQRTRPDEPSDAPSSRGGMWPVPVMAVLALLAIGAAVAGLLFFARVLAFVALGSGMAAGLVGVAWWLRRRRRLMALPDVVRGLLDEQRVRADKHQYRFGTLAVPGTSRIYVQRKMSGVAWREDGTTDRPVTVEEMLREAGNVVVIGQPGTGKSTLLAHIVWTSANWWLSARASDAPRSAPYGPLVPVVIRAEALVDTDVPTAVAGSWPHIEGLTATLLSHQPVRRAAWLVLVDSLDEIRDPEHRAAALLQLGAYIESMPPSNRVVVTSRPLAPGELADLVGRGVAEFRLVSFTQGDVRTFAHQWFEVRSGGLYDFAVERDRFLARITAARLDSIVRVPLITTMAALVYEADRDRSLPTSRAGLYEEFIALLRSGRDAAEEPGTLAAWLTYNMDALLAAMADANVRGGDTRLVEVAENWTREHAPARFTTGPRSSWLGTLIGKLVASGVCALRGSNVEFVHRSIAEYLAADVEAGTLDARELAYRLADPTTRGVTLFGLGRAGGPVDGCVEKLLAPPVADPIAAGRVVADGVPVASTLRGRVVDELVNRLRLDDATAPDCRAVMAGLVADDDIQQRLEEIATDESENPWVRVTVADTLAEVGSETGTAVLHHFATAQEHRSTIAGQWAAMRHVSGTSAAAALGAPPETSDLAQIGPLGRDALRAIATDTRSDATARLEAATMLHRLDEDGALAALRQLAENTGVEPDARRLAAVQLAGTDDPVGLSVLTTLAGDDAVDPQVRRQAAMSLAERGIQDGIDELRRIAGDRRLQARERVLAVSALVDLGDQVGRKLEYAAERRRYRITVTTTSVCAAATFAVVVSSATGEGLAGRNLPGWGALLATAFGLVTAAAVLLIKGRVRATPDDANMEAALELLAQAQYRQLWRAAREGYVQPFPPRVRGNGMTGDFRDFTDTFVSLPQRRLVLTGPPGAGKTVLATQLSFELLRRRQENGAVPVLVSLPSWHPLDVDIETWLTRILSEDPAFARFGTRRLDVARELLRAGRVLPVLDGLDELPEAAQGEAWDQLGAVDMAFVITCRSAEYKHSLGLPNSAVLTLEPLGVETVVAWITQNATAADAAKWGPVLTELSANPDGPLAKVFSTPLLVTLATRVYAVPGTDPAELLDMTRYPTSAALTGDLMSRYLPALYRDPQHRRGPSADQAGRWLAFLSASLDRLGAREFTWWRLEKLMAAWLRALLVLVVAALPIGAAAVTIGADVAQLVSGLILVSTAAVLAAAGFEQGFTKSVDQATSKNSLHIERWWSLAIAAGAIMVCFAIDPAWGAVGSALVWMWPWPRWLLAKAVFAVRRNLPLRLITFLEDARRRGVLRANGSSYWFAHYLLQENLARPGAGR